MPTDPQFGAFHIKRLRAAIDREDVPGDVRTILAATARFLAWRLTDAAVAGCHHCGEGPAGQPCWWCGLRNSKRQLRAGKPKGRPR